MALAICGIGEAQTVNVRTLGAIPDSQKNATPGILRAIEAAKSFAYSDLTITPQQISPDGTIHISLKVSNTGTRNGDEVVQLYLSYVVCRITQPVKRLCAFKRISVAADASPAVTFILRRNDLTFLNEELKPEVSIGSCSILVGCNSRDGLRSTLDVSEVGYGDPYE